MITSVKCEYIDFKDNKPTVVQMTVVGDADELVSIYEYVSKRAMNANATSTKPKKSPKNKGE